jgi:hypothetical protein
VGTLLTLGSIFIGPTFPGSYLDGSQFCSGKAVWLGTTSVGFVPQDQQIVPYKLGSEPTGFYSYVIYTVTYQHISTVIWILNGEHIMINLEWGRVYHYFRQSHVEIMREIFRGGLGESYHGV